MYQARLENTVIKGFYIEEVHGAKACEQVLVEGGLNIDEELHDYLLTLNLSKFTGIRESRVYTIQDKNLFSQIIPPPDNTPVPPTNEDRLAALEAALMGVL